MEHRDTARISMRHVPSAPEPLPHVERLPAIRRTAGRPDEIAAIAGDLLSTCLEAFALEEGIWRQRLRDGAATRWEDVKSHFAEPPPDRFPHLKTPAS